MARTNQVRNEARSPDGAPPDPRGAGACGRPASSRSPAAIRPAAWVHRPVVRWRGGSVVARRPTCRRPVRPALRRCRSATAWRTRLAEARPPLACRSAPPRPAARRHWREHAKARPDPGHGGRAGTRTAPSDASHPAATRKAGAPRPGSPNPARRRFAVGRGGRLSRPRPRRGAQIQRQHWRLAKPQSPHQSRNGGSHRGEVGRPNPCRSAQARQLDHHGVDRPCCEAASDDLGAVDQPRQHHARRVRRLLAKRAAVRLIRRRRTAGSWPCYMISATLSGAKRHPAGVDRTRPAWGAPGCDGNSTAPCSAASPRMRRRVATATSGTSQ